MRLAKGMIAAALLAAAGCDDSPKQQAAGQVPVLTGRALAAREAAEERLRARLRIEGAMVQRGVQVHRQALAETLAVCGQVNASGRTDEPFIPYVAVVVFEGDRAARADLLLGASNQEATRVYIELLDRCYDGGGPQSARATPRPLPPLPDGMPRQAPPSAPATPGAVLPPGTVLPPSAALPPEAPPRPAGQPASGSVTTTARHPVNVRAGPGGSAEVVRIVPRASTLSVFAEAPGGWLQVGEGEPWGWLHSSMLER
jgi:hypothetical protein